MTPNYYVTALSELGQREIEGTKSNPRVLEYQTATGYNAKQDDVPWCGSFVAWCMKQNNIPYRFQTSAAAADWAKFGKALKKPVVGAIIVFPHHVGFFAGWINEKVGSFKLLSGNSGGANAGGGEVRFSNYSSMASVIAIRIPNKMPTPVVAKNVVNQPAVIGGGVAGVGAAASVGDVLTKVSDHKDEIADGLENAQGHLSNGQVLSIVAGLIVLAAVVWVVYSAIRKAQLEKKFSKPPSGGSE
jgi:uncharacterized protein (TIGR02594 family)